MLEETIVGYIDILGYTKLVENHSTDMGLILKLEKILKESSVGLIEDLKKIPPEEEKTDEAYYQKVLEAIKVRYVSDTILFTFPISKNTCSHPELTKEEIISHCIHLYFALISMFCTLFIQKTCYVFRGGISIGPHYENEFNSSGINNLFIFSKAYIDAHELEKAAETARIVISDSLLTYLKKRQYDTGKCFYSDKDNRICFDLYWYLRQQDITKYEKCLYGIKSAVEYSMIEHINDYKALCKLMSFAQYHNMRIRIDKLDLNKLAIGVPKV